jgi:hypothetical protein
MVRIIFFLSIGLHVLVINPSIATHTEATNSSKSAVAAVMAPVPVEYLSFSGEYEGKTVLLKWSTALERNNDYFTIERSSDKVNYIGFKVVRGAGNSAQKSNYSIQDTKPYKGTSYYRLRQTDFEGKSTYSEIITVTNEELPFTFTIYPNPASENDSPRLNFEVEETTQILVVVYDINGNQVYSKIQVIERGPNQVLAIDPSNTLSAGVYMIIATSDNTIIKSKLIIK